MQRVVDDLAAFSGFGIQDDDITVVALHVTDPSEGEVDDNSG